MDWSILISRDKSTFKWAQVLIQTSISQIRWPRTSSCLAIQLVWRQMPMESRQVSNIGRSRSGFSKWERKRTWEGDDWKNMSVDHCNFQCLCAICARSTPNPSKMQLFRIPSQNFTQPAEKESKPPTSTNLQMHQEKMKQNTTPAFLPKLSLIDCGLWVVLIFDARAGFVHAVVRRIC